MFTPLALIRGSGISVMTKFRPAKDQLLSTDQAAQYAGLSKSHIQWLLLKGKLKGVRIGRFWVTTPVNIDEYLATDPRPGPKRRKDKACQL